MRKINREEILSIEEYLKIRATYRLEIQNKKTNRRIFVGPYLNFLFENRDTVKYQILEMILAEKISKEDSIKNEIDTYNEMIPNENELKATLFIEIEDVLERKFKLKELLGLQDEISILIDNKFYIKAVCDKTQIDKDKISSVQFLTFEFSHELKEKFLNSNNVEIVTTHSCCSYKYKLTEIQLNTLKQDFS